jgi:hypothetical protein
MEHHKLRAGRLVPRFQGKQQETGEDHWAFVEVEGLDVEWQVRLSLFLGSKECPNYGEYRI